MQQLRGFLIIVFGFLMVCHSTVYGQEKRVKGGGAGYFSVGYANFKTDALNDFLPEGTADLSNNHLMVGGGGHSYMGNFIIGGSGYGWSGETISADSFEANTVGGVGFLNLGYKVVNKTNFGFYPLLGIGGGDFGIKILEERNLDVETIKADPGQSIEINQQGLLLDLSLNAEFYPFAGDKEEDGKGGLLTGLKVGYIYQPFASGDWEYDGGNINGGPDFNLNGFYAQITFGGFGISRKQ